MTRFIARLPRRHSPGITQNTRSSAPWRPASRPRQDAQIGGSASVLPDFSRYSLWCCRSMWSEADPGNVDVSDLPEVAAHPPGSPRYPDPAAGTAGQLSRRVPQRNGGTVM